MRNAVVLGVVVVVGVVAFLYLRGRLNAPSAQLREKAGKAMAEGSVDRVEKSDAEWKRELTPEQYHVTRKKGTERAFTGAFWNDKTPGTFNCVCCGQELFDAKTKFESGTGWPSFYEPTKENAVGLVRDESLFMTRIEVVCSRCDAHLGHVFDDGPAPTGLRYCINSSSLKRGEAKKTP